jgi:hypothetical protein
LVTYFYWRFPAPPALEASKNGPIPQAVHLANRLWKWIFTCKKFPKKPENK